KRVLFPALQKVLGNYSGEQTGAYDGIEGAYDLLSQVELVDQNPIGRSSRSNPVTYVKAWDEIRSLYASQSSAKAAGLKPAAFSFNVEGGRCDVCQGEGEVKIEMQFMADIYLPCEACGGKRFKQHVLDITYKEKTVSEVLDMTIDEALAFFKEEQKIVNKLQPLADVGLGYVKLGQSSNTLSGGEAQRIKLASFLIKGNNSHKSLFILDITYKEKTVSEVLDMTIDEALAFFKEEQKIVNKLQPLADVGLGYVKLGQSSNTLSGGEAQRIKLASFLIKGNNSHKSLFIFD